MCVCVHVCICDDVIQLATAEERPYVPSTGEKRGEEKRRGEERRGEKRREEKRREEKRKERR